MHLTEPLIRVLVAIALAVGAGLALWFLAKASPVAALTASVAVYGAALASLQSLADRHDLHVDFGFIPYGDPDTDGEIFVRLYNRGRRPVGVEAAGFATTKSNEPLEYDLWWGKIMPPANPLAATLDERRPSVDLVAFPSMIADWYADEWSGPPSWLFARLGHNQNRWWPLPADLRAFLVDAWPVAVARAAKRPQTRS